ncbi:hypothetical protein [Bifidobacterium pullorum]|uniref:hypothetical protein n=1 Tax=Bifidobacterium pullorum TaxID=78448 RepID=UPI00320A561B
MTNEYKSPRQALVGLAEGENKATQLYGLLAGLLDRIATWLLGYAYGGYRETVSRRAVALADTMALASYANVLTPVPVSFDATGEDTPARRLLDAAAFLIPQCHVMLAACPKPVAHINVETAPLDRRTGELAELPLLPALVNADRGTAAMLRRDLLTDARERSAHILSNGDTPASVVTSVAAAAGGRWPTIAAMLLAPDKLPSMSAACDGKGVDNDR